MSDDPFTHHPELRGKIADPLGSAYRSVSLAMLDEKMEAAGAAPGWRYSDVQREATRREALGGRPREDLWVFAYGSLMWDPAFLFAEVRVARLEGYRRSFCLKSVLGRGTRERPGLMAGLDEGERCSGLVFRIEADRVDEETQVIWKREMLLHAYTPRFVGLETARGPVEALAFVIDPTAEAYLPGMSTQETARFMATGSGIFGSSLAYLENIADNIAAIGIEDRALLELRDLARQLATA